MHQSLASSIIIFLSHVTKFDQKGVSHFSFATLPYVQGALSERQFLKHFKGNSWKHSKHLFSSI